MRGQRPVEHRLGRGERRGHRLGAADLIAGALHLAGDPERLGQQPEERDGPAHHVPHPAEHELQRIRIAHVRADQRRILLRCRGVGGGERGQQLGAEHPVDHRMMDPEEHRHPRSRVLLRAPVTAAPLLAGALDEPRLPQRVRTIDRRRRELPAQREELALIRRRIHPDQLDVAGDVEVEVLDPRRVPHVQRRVVDLAPKRRNLLHPPREPTAHPLEGVALGDGRDVQMHDAVDRHLLLLGLQVQKARVQSRHAFHGEAFLVNALVNGRVCARESARVNSRWCPPVGDGRAVVLSSS